MTAPSRAARRPLPLWLPATLLALCLRALLAASRLDELELERYNANLGWALLHGLPLDTSQLPVIPHLRGSVVFGVLLVPLLWLCGPSLLALKALAVLWGAWIVGLTSALAERHLGRPAGLLASVLALLATPAMACVDVLALGSHVDSIVFILLPLWWSGKPHRGLWAATVYGLLLGLGLLFSMQFWVALPAIVAFWWFTGQPEAPRPLGLRLAKLSLCALLAAPSILLIPFLTRRATLVNRPIADRILPDGFGAAFERLWDLLSQDLRRSWLFEEQGLAWVSYALYAWMVLGALFAIARVCGAPLIRRTDPAWAGPRRLWVFALLHVGGLSAAYAISDFRLNFEGTADGMGSRYLMPIWPALAFLAAAPLAAWRGRPAPAWLSGLSLLAALPLAAAWWPLLHPSRSLDQPPVLATEMYAFHAHLRRATPDDPAARWGWIRRLDPNWPAWTPLAYGGDFAPPAGTALEGLRSELQRAQALEGELRQASLSGLGRALAEAHRERQVRGLRYPPLAAGLPGAELGRRIAAEAQSFTDADFLWYSAGAGRALAPLLIGETLVVRQLTRDGKAARVGRYRPLDEGWAWLAAWPERGRAALALGLGFQLGLRLSPYDPSADAVLAGLAAVPAAEQEPLFRGLWAGYRMRFIEASYRPPRGLRALEKLPPQGRAAVEAALRAASEPPFP
jgi:hypothetical protein